MSPFKFACFMLTMLLASGSNLWAQAKAAPHEELAGWMLGQLAAKKGLALDLGCGDARLAIALARQSELIIECVDADPDVVAKAKKTIDLAGMYGTRVTAASAEWTRLEYPSYSANLIVCGDEFVQGLQGRNLRELFRVLSPNGIAIVGQSAGTVGQKLKRQELEKWLRDANITSYTILEERGVWARITQPRQVGWDEWTHRSHDPSNTFGSNDTLAGPHFKTQWISDFRPGLSSAAVAAAGGRIITASLSYDKFPDTTPHIQALDAFTGVELWAKVGQKELPIDRPPTLYSNRESCSDMALVGDRLYLLGGKFCHVIDVRDGKMEKSLPIPAEAEPTEKDAWLYMAVVGDLIYGSVGKAPGVKVDWNSMHYRGVSKALFALDRTTGKLRWIQRVPATICSLCLGDGKFFYCDDQLKLHALDAVTGKKLWSQPLPYREGTEIAGCTFNRDKVFLLYNQPLANKKASGPAALLTAGHNLRELAAFSVKDGKHLFECEFGTKVAGVSFAGGFIFGSGQHGGEGVAVVDVETGKLKWKSREPLKCTPSLATLNCFLTQRSACPAIFDLKFLQSANLSEKTTRTSFTGYRPSCSYPGVPANGMVYLQAEGCACASPLRGNIALIPGQPAELDVSNQLTKGSAFAEEIAEEGGPAWATWRADHLRSGQSKELAPEKLDLLWNVQFPGRLTSMSAGQGLVLFGSSDRKVYALDASTGKQAWQHIGAGRVQAAPFLWKGRLYCTDDDGWAYCLRADSGAVVWHFRAALGAERIVGYGGFMSRWPARTGVLVHDDVAYFAAGLFPDEGTVVYAVDPRTGEKRWQKDFNTQNKGGRTAGFVPDGALALAHNRLYIPSGSGIPWQIELDSPERKASFTGGYHVRGHHIMVADKDLLAVTPGLQFVHHVHYKGDDEKDRLPVVTPESIYLLNHPSKSSRYLAAGKREEFNLVQNRLAFLVPNKSTTAAKAIRWQSWKDEPMSVSILAGTTIFSGGPKKIYATRSEDGKELWSATVPSPVADLAVNAGRLFVLCESGTILCFGKAR